MSSILRKVKSVPNLIKRRKSGQKLEKLCDPIYEPEPLRPRNWLFLEHCRLMTELVDYFIMLHEDEDDEKKEVWYWANDIDEENPMTYQVDSKSTVSNSLLFHQQPDSSSTVPLTITQQADFARYFKAYRPRRRL